MRTSLTPKQIVSAVSTLAVLSLAWAFLAPTAVGGSATYVVTDGVSMQPRFHAGDLAVVRRESSYHVGEIVAYHSRMLHTVVLHRIVGISNGHYRFKGDNNGFVDSEHPVRSQLVGQLWLHVPGIGAHLGHRMHGTEADSILSRYRNLLVQVVHVRDPSTQRVVVVSDMAALGRIAERYDRMILHEKVAGQDAYFVAEDGVLYRYEAAGTRPTLVADVSSVAQAG